MMSLLILLKIENLGNTVKLLQIFYKICSNISNLTEVFEKKNKELKEK